ncbi:MAG: S8 family peptidase [Proteobacteria bacterium]|nr:S8 family peptidase [Pseudomonadota bacterium]
MADQRYPYLLLPTVTSTQRDGLTPGRTTVQRPPIERQRVRIGPKFQALQNTFDAKRLQLQQTAPGRDPELVIVFETVGDVKDFFKAVKKVSGLEWLFEAAEEDISPDEDFYVADDPEKSLSGRLFLVGTNQEALTQVLSLWNRYQQDTSVTFARGLAPWKHVFEQLKHVRYWSVQDRLEPDVRQYWRNKIDAGVDPIRFEIEIWHFASAEKNDAARSEVSDLVTALGGRVLSRTVIDDIAYHGMLVEMPAAAVEQLLADAPPELVMSDRIMFFRPQGQAAVPRADDDSALMDQAPVAAAVAGEPVVALLDGLPLQNHPLLAGRLTVEDPDGWEATYPAQERVHGTSMASLIALGDLDAGEAPLARPIYVRPVMRPDPHSPDAPRGEATPDDVLLIDLMHRAIRRIFEGDGDEPAAAPTVRIINLSLGDADRPFDRALSPWARLLDWLAFKYQVLFVISAGNHAQELTLPTPRESLAGLPPEERHTLALQSHLGQSITRPLLVPAEALNGLTVGAFHADAAQFPVFPGRYDLFEAAGISPYSRIGYGFRRAVKPDLLFPGGRMLHSEQIAGPPESTTVRPLWKTSAAPGHRVAVLPDAAGNTRYTRGTSNAAALASRHAAKAFDVIEALRAAYPERLPSRFDAVLLKAIVAHGARWGDSFDRLGALMPELDKRELKLLASRWMGYGKVDSERALFCTEERATMVGIGELTKDQAYAFSAPLPPGLNAKVLWRRLTVTLAWLSPTNAAHQAYRRARLWIAPPSDPLGVARMEADWQQAKKGTLQHEVLEGDNALAFVDGDRFVCKVNCAADAGDLVESVPFALCVSLEVAEGVGVEVYEEMRARITPQVQVGAAGAQE